MTNERTLHATTKHLVSIFFLRTFGAGGREVGTGRRVVAGAAAITIEEQSTDAGMSIVCRCSPWLTPRCTTTDTRCQHW